ncbi:MAG: tripartite tricarboxylate transporter TctB family protein [Casimicrobiaceae bacterium]|nr:tripartite tricarboxylate transporter TctB family protein [Casimicrobiaceae bacterium]MCX8098607.1 tripartite tricarboxylate transporter TctB family protein [Casimicrobiaceae bacterium]MDW8312481.1 tripartite tricarboxylate transporter TctB family protein [Burkholderiales bacterium]
MNAFFKNKDLLAGLMFIVVGLAFFAGAYNYTMGTAARMGPGYFPRILGGLLVFMGLLIAGVGLKNQAKAAQSQGIGWKWTPVILVTLAVILFAVVLPRLGLIAAILVLIGLAGYAAHDRNYRELALIALAMCVFCASVFVYGLKLQLKLWPWS